MPSTLRGSRRMHHQREQGLHKLVLNNLTKLQMLRAHQSGDHPWSAGSKQELQSLRDATGCTLKEKGRLRKLVIEAELV